MLNCWGAEQDHWFSDWILLLFEKICCSCQTSPNNSSVHLVIKLPKNTWVENTTQLGYFCFLATILSTPLGLMRNLLRFQQRQNFTQVLLKPHLFLDQPLPLVQVCTAPSPKRLNVFLMFSTCLFFLNGNKELPRRQRLFKNWNLVQKM